MPEAMKIRLSVDSLNRPDRLCRRMALDGREGELEPAPASCRSPNPGIFNGCNAACTPLSTTGHERTVAVTSEFLAASGIEWPVFGDQVEFENFRTRPQPAGRGYVSIFAGGAPGDRVDWPVFGEQIDDLTAATRPQPADQAFMGYVSNRLGRDIHFSRLAGSTRP